MSDLKHLISAYEALLRISPASAWRIKHQDIYVQLLEAISAKTGHDAEFIQNTFEHMQIIKG